MSELLERKSRYHEFKTNRKRLCRKKISSTEKDFVDVRESQNGCVFPKNTTTSFPNYASGCNTSFVTMVTSPVATATITTTTTTAVTLSTNHECLNQSPSNPTSICNNHTAENAGDTSNKNYSCSSPTPSDRLMPSPLKSYPTSDEDDEMIVDSPDSGFESATPGSSIADYFDENSKSDSFSETKENLSRSSSLNCDVIEESAISLVPSSKVEPPPAKKEQKASCCWDDCCEAFPNNRELHLHLEASHVNPSITNFCCLWKNCKVFNKPTRNLSCLQQHVRSHTGVKRFQCPLAGCDASFSSQSGLARHVPSHFSDFNLPKAKLPGNGERRVLVKRRKVKNKKKALANIHDCMDQRTINTLVKSLVIRNHMTSHPETSQESYTRRRNAQGQVWKLKDDLTWKLDTELSFEHQKLFFAAKRSRSRKTKAHF